MPRRLLPSVRVRTAAPPHRGGGPTGRKRLWHPDRGTVEFACTAFHLAEQSEQTLVIYSDDRQVAASALATTCVA
ncbi:hypothetical protein BM536_008265 [Streptomyces phaeoluteigriseus]|uniref:Uncharacterized protein n=1 Tax=Streptomyces phaeoluteigriseus TaxID=114686 RepID=A0A1V6MUX9_9ACTN|nr:hypothetical protein BM536_008265 [Streptomyces phaeoluteigriseus]